MIAARVTADDVAPAIKRQQNGLAAGIRAAVDASSAGLQTGLRAQVLAAGLGTRLAQAWRRKMYPEGGEGTLSPAALVWSKAPTLIRAYAEGTLIRPRTGGQALAIPTDRVPSKGNRRMTPAEVEARFGRKLRFVPMSNGRAALVMDQVVVSRTGSLRRAPARPTGTGRRGTSVVMFVLVRQVLVKKRLDIDQAAEAAQGNLSGRVSALARG